MRHNMTQSLLFDLSHRRAIHSPGGVEGLAIGLWKAHHLLFVYLVSMAWGNFWITLKKPCSNAYVMRCYLFIVTLGLVAGPPFSWSKLFEYSSTRNQKQKVWKKKLRPMTHAPETGAINALHFSGADFWYVSCKSWTGFFWYQILAPIRALFYSWPESGVHVTGMMTCDWSMIIVDVLRCREVVLCHLFIHIIFSDMFIYGARNFHSRRTRNQKSAPISGAGKWSRFMAPVSVACVMGMRQGPVPVPSKSVLWRVMQETNAGMYDNESYIGHLVLSDEQNEVIVATDVYALSFVLSNV